MMFRNLKPIRRDRIHRPLGFAVVLLTILFLWGSAQAAPADYSFYTSNFGGPGGVPYTPGLPFTTQTPVGPGSLTTGFQLLPIPPTPTPSPVAEIWPGVYAQTEHWQFDMVNQNGVPLVSEINDPSLYSYMQVGDETLSPLTWDGANPVYGAHYGSSDPWHPWNQFRWEFGGVLWFSTGGVPEPVVDVLSLGLPLGPHPLGLGFDVVYFWLGEGLLDTIGIASNEWSPTDPTFGLQQMMYTMGANSSAVDGFHVAYLVTQQEIMPEPSAVILLGGALAGLALLLRRARA